MLLTVLALLFTALILGAIMEKIQLPALLGFMLAGIIFSPYTAELFALNGNFFKSLFLTHQQTIDSAPIRTIAIRDEKL